MFIASKIKFGPNPLCRLIVGPQVKGDICLFSVHGYLDFDINAGSFPRKILGTFDVLADQVKVPIRKYYPIWNESTGLYEFKIFFTLIVGFKYNVIVSFTGEADSVEEFAVGPTVSDPLTWDLTV